jgi:DNA helicase-2/ATP-dependent DNA helicase PcrA
MKTAVKTKLADDQIKSISHYKGPALVIAGPGAGKTLIITERVKKLILDHKINPRNILVTTFTEKAANELKIKLAKTVGKNAELIHISTIHSFCKAMLEKHFLHHNYGAVINVLDDESQTLFIQLNKANLGISKWGGGILKDLKKRYDYIGDIKKLYDQITQNMINTDKLILELKRKNEIDDISEKIIRSYETYRDMLRQEKRMDFSMLETTFFELINENQKILDEIQDQFQFILVDEYQDTSPIQDRIFRKLSDKYKNIFVVGDENQSIYGFRGASIKNFKNFLNVYDGAKSFFLDINFRSTETIVNFSNKIFEAEVKKILKSKRRKGEHFKLIYGKDSDDTAKHTIELLERLKKSGIIEKYGDVALLFRSLKLHSPEYVKYLTKKKIPFVTFGDGKFLERPEIRTIIYLMSYVTQELYLDNRFEKWSHWWRKDIFLSDFLNFSDSTKKTIKEGDFDLYKLKDYDDFKKVGFSDTNDIKKLEKINKLKYDVQREKESFGDLEIGNNTLLKIFYKLLDYSGYFNTLMEMQSVENKEKLHNLGRLSEIIARYMDLSRKEGVKGFLWYIYSMDNKIDQHKIEDEHTVKLMTVHQSKGLEFPVVILCCLNEGRFPLKYWDRSMIKIPLKFLNREDIEDDMEAFFQEERRLFYVAITRAQDILTFTSSEKHVTQSSKKSRFLDIVEEEISESEFKLPIEKKYSIEKRVPSLNYSSINTFIDCPLRYTLIYDYGFVTPPSFMQNLGTFIHNVLQRIHECMKGGNAISPQQMKEIVKTYWIDLPMSKKRNENIKQKLIKEFVNYYVSVKDKYVEIIAIEESFSHIDDSMIIKGKVDLIVRDNDGNIDLIDFKASKQKGIEETNVDKQLQIYSYCLDNEFKINKLLAHTFRDNKNIEFPINKLKTKDFLKSISKKIAQENFHKQKNAFCKDCQFEFHCWGDKQ